MTQQASGTFQVKLSPQAPADSEEPTVGRLLLDKVFSGDLEAISAGQMLALQTETENSAGYVAIERRGHRAGQRPPAWPPGQFRTSA